MAQQHSDRTAHLIQGSMMVPRMYVTFRAPLPQPQSLRNPLRRIGFVAMHVCKFCNT